MKKMFFLILLMMGFASTAHAYECTAKVNNLVVAPTGVVSFSFGSMNEVYLCSVNTTYNTVAPDACKSIVSLLMAAKLSDKNVRMWFNDASNSCTNTGHAAWADLKGWYYGPALL
jgi:hypothetical protein